MKRLLCLLLALCMVLSLTACGGQPESIQLFAMDTVMDLTAYGENAAAALTDASREINRLERLLSRTIDTSEISQINAGGAVTVSEETASLLAQAQTYTAATDGAFDVTIAPLVSLWGITTDSPYVPTQQEIDALLPLVGSEHLHLSGDTATLDDGCAIDLGGIAKGYASDRVEAAICARHGADRRPPSSLGGNVLRAAAPSPTGSRLAGGRPGSRRTPSAYAGIRGPDGRLRRHLRRLPALLRPTPDGTVYQHILDPKTGYPVRAACCPSRWWPPPTARTTIPRPPPRQRRHVPTPIPPPSIVLGRAGGPGLLAHLTAMASSWSLVTHRRPGPGAPPVSPTASTPTEGQRVPL